MSLPPSLWPTRPKTYPLVWGFKRYALHFDGSSYVSVPSTSDLALGDEATWELIFKFVENGSDQGLLAKGTWSADSDYALPFRTDRRLRLWLSDGTTEETRASDSALSPDRWYHVCVVFRRSDLSVEFWINGELDSRKTFTINPQSVVDVVHVGRAGGWFLAGDIALFRYYTQALTGRGIRHNMLNYTSPILDGLVLWLHDRMTADTWYDDSSRGNDGSVSGATVAPLSMWSTREEVGL